MLTTNQTKKMNYYQGSSNERQESRTANSRFAKPGVSCFYESEVLNSSFVHFMNIFAKNPHQRKSRNRYLQNTEPTNIDKLTCELHEKPNFYRNLALWLNLSKTKRTFLKVLLYQTCQNLYKNQNHNLRLIAWRQILLFRYHLP